MAGRPTKFTPELANLICERVATHALGLRRLCEKYSDLPSSETINQWRYRDQAFSVQYARAKIRQADFIAEEIIDLSHDKENDIIYDDNGKPMFNSVSVARNRLQVDTLKWMAAKLLPKQYGKMAEEHQVVEDSKDDIIKQLINKLPD